MGRGRITGSDPADYTHTTTEQFVEQHNPAGEIFYVLASDPGYAYVLADDTLQLVRYPLAYIWWHGVTNPIPSGAATQQTRTGQIRELTTTAALGRRPVCYGRVRIGSSIGPIGTRPIDPTTLYVQHCLGIGEFDALEKMLLPFGGQLTDCGNITSGTGTFGGSLIGQFYPGKINPTAGVRLISLVASGSGYTSDPTVTITAGIGGGSGATATAHVVAGAVVSFTMLTEGSGYTTQPTVAFSGGGGSGAAATAILRADPRAILLLGNNAVQIYPGLAHIWAAYTYNSSIFTTPPDQAKFIVRARKIYDPRKDSTVGGSGSHRANDPTTWEWSQNDALCTADYLRDSYFGMGRPITDWAPWADGADYCDQIMGDGSKRHTLNITLMREASERSNLDTLRSHWRATIFKRDDGYVCSVVRAKSVAYTWNADNAMPGRIERVGSDQIPTRIRGTYTDPNKDYQATQLVAETDGVKNGVEEIRQADYSFEGIDNPGEMTRQNLWLLYSRLANLNVDFTATTAEGLQGEVGDRIQYTSPLMGLASTYLTIVRTSWSAAENKIVFGCSLYPANAFSDVTAAIETPVATSFPDPLAGLPAPTGLTLTEQVDQPQPGTFIPKLIVDFAPYAGPFYGGTQIGYTVDGGTERFLPVQMVPTALLTIPDGLGRTVVVNAYTINANTKLPGTLFATQTHTMYNPSNTPVINAATTVVVSGSNTGVYWSRPQTQSAVATSAWASNGMTSFDAAKMNDGNLSVLASEMPLAGAGYDPSTAPTGKYVQFTAASSFSQINIYLTSGNLATPYNFSSVYLGLNQLFTFNGSAWVLVNQTGFKYSTIDVNTALIQTPSPLAAGQYRITRNDSTSGGPNAILITEISLIAFTGITFPYIKGYRVRGYNIFGHYWSKDILFTPDSSNLISIDEFKREDRDFISLGNVMVVTGGSWLIQAATIDSDNGTSQYVTIYNLTQFVSYSVTPTAMHLGPSSFTDGPFGIGTSSPAAALHVYGVSTSDVFVGVGEDPAGTAGNQSAMNFGYAGNSLGRGVGFFNVRPDSVATAPNPSLRFLTANVERFRADATGFVIGAGAGISKHVSVTSSWIPGTINVGVAVAQSFSVTGAALGDTAVASFNPSFTGMMISASVLSAGTVEVILYNQSGVNQTPGTGAVRIDVWKH